MDQNVIGGSATRRLVAIPLILEVGSKYKCVRESC
jgi:hypothetical protein